MTKAAVLDRKATDHGIVVLATVVLANVVRGTPARRSVVREMLALRDGDRKVVMIAREVNAVPKVGRNTVREDLRLAAPDLSTVDHSPGRRAARKADAGAKADVLLAGRRVSMAGTLDVVMIADVDSVVLRRSLDEGTLVVRRHS